MVRKTRGVLCTKGQGWVVVGESSSHHRHHHHRHHGGWHKTEWQRVYGRTGMIKMDWVKRAYWGKAVMETDWAMGSICLGDPGVDSHHLILSYNKLHTLSFPAFARTGSIQDFIDPCDCMDAHGRVVRYLLTISLHSSTLYHFFSRIHFGRRERYGGVLMKGSLPSTSVVSPHRQQN